MLTLTIEKKWFDMILSGEKTEEYRELKRYYDSRFRNAAMREVSERICSGCPVLPGRL